MKKSFSILSILLVVCLVAYASPAAAQDGTDLKLSLSKDFGYSSGFGGARVRMQGTFSLKIQGPDDLERVVFYLNDQVLGEDTAAPFRLQFTTDSYPNGTYTMAAIGYTTTGRELRSNVINGEFLTAEQGWQDTLRIIVPLFGLIFGGMALAAIVSGLLSRGKPKTAAGARRNYGPFGGAICPGCKRPFSRSILGINLVLGKLERCPHCGKWSLTRAAPMEILRAAEEAELSGAEPGEQFVEMSEEERLRKELEKSRYDN